MTAFVHKFEPASDSHGTLALLHGTGGDESSLMRFASEAAPTWSRLGIRGRSLEEGVPRFFRRIAEGVFDEEDVRRRAEELADFLARAGSSYGLDPKRLILIGYSNGANMAAAMLLLHPETQAGAALLRPMPPLRQPPILGLQGKSALILAGARDRICPPAEAEKLRNSLQGAGADVSLQRIDAGHELTLGDVDALRWWLQQEKAEPDLRRKEA